MHTRQADLYIYLFLYYYLFTYLFIYWFIYLFIYLVINLSIYDIYPCLSSFFRFNARHLNMLNIFAVLIM